ncbi:MULTISPECIES: hypothetical protein [Legionella]|uniref:Uncharacterized protein n=1 Tax=Legionella maceachernii TaxID=466 RepID=A0A0W0VYP3_9GAMM|nr:hypothetical protein [Legionella maceachernii]KTD25113.1 hypothetical protein Lmac_2091 [Legionella maceachernii]SKA28858.1 hypothetical protein SAMN02745128_03064 [Legionella maceachernii]SUP02505.1 Uncharacterised protein [Legionella maceachernii]
MQHERFIQQLVSQFKEKLNGLSSEQLANLNLEIALIPTVGNEAGGAAGERKRKPSSPPLPQTGPQPGRTLPELKKGN